MKAIDKVGGERRHLLWKGWGGGGGRREKKKTGGCGSEMVFKWADRVQFWQNEGFFYCWVNELTVGSNIEAFCN